eukprot:scaffold34663_cov205-Amphora_coffeaeformis.AAC.1
MDVEMKAICSSGEGSDIKDSRRGLLWTTDVLVAPKRQLAVTAGCGVLGLVDGHGILAIQSLPSKKAVVTLRSLI